VEASTSLRSKYEEAAELLRDDPGVVVVERPTEAEDRDKCFCTVLSVPIGGGGLHHEIELRTEAARAADDGTALPVRWHATGHERRFPTFEGELAVRPGADGTSLVLRGDYEIPYGAGGWVGDHVGGHHFAVQSLSLFVEQAAFRLDAEVDRRRSAPTHPHPPYVIDLREVGSENYLG